MVKVVNRRPAMREALALEVPACRSERAVNGPGNRDPMLLPCPQLEAALAWVGLDEEAAVDLGRWTMAPRDSHRFGPSAREADACDVVGNPGSEASDVEADDSDYEERMAPGPHAWPPASDSEGEGSGPDPCEFFPW